MYIFFIIHSSASGHLHCSCVLAIVNHIPRNKRVHVFFSTMFFSGYMPRSMIAGSYDSSNFSFLKNLHAALHSGYTNLHSHQKCKRAPFPRHPLWLFLVYELLMTVILTGGRWYFIAVLTYICLIVMLSILIYLLAICMSSLEKCLFGASVHILIVLFFVCFW